MKSKILKYKYYLVVLAVYLVAFIFGCFFDLKIDQAIANELNPFAQIFATFTSVPTCFVWCMAGTALLKLTFKNPDLKIIYKIIFMIVGLVAIVFAFLNMQSYFAKESIVFVEYFKDNIVLPYVVSGVLVIAFVTFSYFFITSTNKEFILRVSVFTIIIGVCSYLTSTILKSVWSRPRFRLIYAGAEYKGVTYTVEELFRPVFMPGLGGGIPYKELHYLSNSPLINLSQFKSFPSGHSGDAACSLAMFAIPLLNEKQKDKRWLRKTLFAIAEIWTTLVMFSRLVHGAHYLTDVTMGASITIGYICLSKYLVFHKKEDEVDNFEKLCKAK